MEAFAPRRRRIFFASVERPPEEVPPKSRRVWRFRRSRSDAPETDGPHRPPPEGLGPGSGESPWKGYAVGASLGAAAILLRLISKPLLGDDFLLLTAFPALVAASWWGGFGPALVTLGVTLAAFSWVPPAPGGAVRGVASPILGLGLYALAGGGVAYFGGRMRSSLTASECARLAAQERHARLEQEAGEQRRASQAEEERLLRQQVELRETAEDQSRRLEELLVELREKNAFLMAILRQVPSGIVVAEAGTSRVLLSNDEAEQIIRGGLQPGLRIERQVESDELVGLRPDGSRYEVEEWPLMRTLARGETVVDEEIDLVFCDGEKRRICVNSGPALDDRGRMVAAVAAFHDVTTRRAAEAAVTESERWFRQLAEAIPQIVFMTRLDDSIVYLNRRWFDYTGATEADAKVDGGPIGVVHPEDVAAILAERSKSKETGEPLELEYRIRGRDGSYRWFLGRSMWLRDASGGLLYRFGTATDIDDRKRSEQAARFLADAGAKLAAVVDAESTLREIARLAVPYFADWSAVDVLEEGGELRRVAVAYGEGEPIDVMDTISHRYRLRADMPHGLFEVVQTRRPALIAEVTEDNLRSGARNEEHLEALRSFGPRSYLCVPMVGREGVLGALSFATTHSGRHFDDADLQLALELAGRAAIAVENGRLYDRLREADRRKDDFLATLAHELRNPMAPIRNSVQILQMKGGGDADAEWARDVIDRQVGHLSRLVDDLLDVSRITREKLDLRPERIQVAAAVAAAVEISRPTIDGKGQVLHVDLPADPVALDADPTRLAQVLANLLDNASKFSPRETRIDLGVARRGREVEIRVKDHGIGIRPEQIPHVFEMFAQFAPILERPQGGLGIGLALVKGVVELHKGTVEACSEGPGLGSEFVVRLPLSDGGSSPTREESAPTREAAPSQARVLVVDDSEDIAESLGRLLTLQGCEVHLAHDGEQAFVLACRLRPDFAVLDIGLPGMNGYELARAIRGEPWGRDVVLIAVTGWGRLNDRARSGEAGFDHHLVKPVEPDALVQIIADPSAGSS
ncbi:ATP-binding protein [Paludisphaera mucosa]|uniref:histidine kinase n=1 Tax=Paludisphaera mucosa TaxID=3030827 RepID=A0ABT6FF81_9BACT|nr:ATP-binding protein [Paludisphaera mucosa]MDG3006154.1 ATP-binding protein [Paludisphaera mucosa]